MEEERERELEQLYEAGIAETMNREDVAMDIDAEETSGHTQSAEVTAVSKQTTETLMAGERIMEALELADNERDKFREYEEAMAKLSEDDPMKMQPPPKNPVLAAYNLEPEEHVLRVIEKVPSTALHDALLVLPFGKVVSLMHYLNAWVQKVRPPILLRKNVLSFDRIHLGLEHTLGISNHVFPFEGSPPSNCGESHHENYTHPVP